jgi:hypothetical protein
VKQEIDKIKDILKANNIVRKVQMYEVFKFSISDETEHNLSKEEIRSMFKVTDWLDFMFLFFLFFFHSFDFARFLIFAFY